MPVNAIQYRTMVGRHPQAQGAVSTPRTAATRTWPDSPERAEMRHLTGLVLHSRNSPQPFMPPPRQRNTLRKTLLLGLLLSQIRIADSRPPATDSAIFPMLSEAPRPALEWDRAQQVLIIRDAQKKQQLAAALRPLLLPAQPQPESLEAAVDDWLSQQLVRGDIVLAPPLNNSAAAADARKRRESQSDREKRIGAHIQQHCAVEEEILDTEGKDLGRVLLYRAQNAEQPFRVIYSDRPGTAPAPWERGVADGLDKLLSVLTFGLKDAIGAIVASRYRKTLYQERGDAICSERQDRLALAHGFLGMELGALEYNMANKGARLFTRPLELADSLPPRQRAAFYARNPLTNTQQELLLQVKGHRAIDRAGQQVLLKPTANGDYVTWHPAARNSQLLEKRVVVDTHTRTWRYADDFNAEPLNVEIITGKKFITIQHGKYELQMNKAREYEIVVHKLRDGARLQEYQPVYMEPLSRSWHLKTHNNHPVFTKAQLAVIKETGIMPQPDKHYRLVENLNKAWYGNGKIVEVRSQDKSIYEAAPLYYAVEMHGVLVPVQPVVTPGHGVSYKVYRRQAVKKDGLNIEWDGYRWVFEQPTSSQVSKRLRKLLRSLDDNAPLTSKALSAPDRNGLRWSEDNRAWLKVDGRYVRIYPLPDERFLIRRQPGQTGIYIRRHNNKLQPETTAERLNYIQQVGLNGKGKRSAQEILAGLDGFNPQLGEALLNLYHFPDGAFYNAENFARYIEQYGEIPAWAAIFRNPGQHNDPFIVAGALAEWQQSAQQKLSELPGFNRQRASELLSQYQFTDPTLFDADMFIEYIRMFGEIPPWAEAYRIPARTADAAYQPDNQAHPVRLPERAHNSAPAKNEAPEVGLDDLMQLGDSVAWPSPVDILSQVPGYTRYQAASLLSYYHFPPEADYDGYMLVQYIRQYGVPDPEAEKFKIKPGLVPLPIRRRVDDDYNPVPKAFKVFDIEKLDAPPIVLYGALKRTMTANRHIYNIIGDSRYILKCYPPKKGVAMTKERIQAHVDGFRRYYGQDAAFGYIGPGDRWYIKMIPVPGELVSRVKTLPEDAEKRFLDMEERLASCGIMPGEIDMYNVYWDEKNQIFYPLGITYYDPKPAPQPGIAGKYRDHLQRQFILEAIRKRVREGIRLRSGPAVIE